MSHPHSNEVRDVRAPTSTEDGAADPAPVSGPPRRLVWPVCAMAVAVVALPLVFTGYSDELGRWRLAAAWEKRLDGDLAGAIACLDEALALTPDHVELHLQRAAWHGQMEQFEAALDDYNKVFEIANNDPRMLLGRAMTLHRMGRAGEALRDLELYLKKQQGADRANALNTLAYFRAVNNTTLDQALTEINKAIDLETPNAAGTASRSPNPALLDTRGFIHYRLGDFAAARTDLELAVKAYAFYFASQQHQFNTDQLGVIDLRVHKLKLHAARQAFAVVVYHRGLIYEQLGETDQAQADFDQVRELGFEPNDDLY